MVASCCDKNEQAKWYCDLLRILTFPLINAQRSAAVESKVRQLVSKLELTQQLERVHPFVKGFDKTYHTINMQEHGDVVLGNVSPSVASRTEEEAKALAPEEWQAIYTTTYYIGLEIKRLENGMSQHNLSNIPTIHPNILANDNGPRRLDISAPTSEFMKLARGWEAYQNEIMGIAVRHIKKSVILDLSGIVLQKR